VSRFRSASGSRERPSREESTMSVKRIVTVLRAPGLGSRAFGVAGPEEVAFARGLAEEIVI
jgi:hypothetical protein